ncbi:gluconate 5-dehydrogenase [Penicillium capsulatum]|nr:gluconate 5-dehydrogenase [Penicillium capsulatum]
MNNLPTNQLFSLEGKTVICTGATGGIGQSLCKSLAEAGADIISIQIPNDPNAGSLSKCLTELGRKLWTFECNLTEPSSVRSTFRNIWNAGISPSVLLNCAGVNRRRPLTEVTDEDLELILSINLKATYIAAQEYAKRLLELKLPGKMINVGSVTSFRGMYNVSAYASSKGGVVQMTKSFSNELAPHNIQQLENDPVYNDFILKATPAGRWGTPEDLRGACIFLASDASNFVTGSSLIVDGGMVAA